MYVIRNIMQAKPGKGKDLTAILKAAIPHFEYMGPKRLRVLNDVVGSTWTIVMEMEVESVNTYFDILEGRSKSPELANVMKGYTDLITGGKREIFRIV